MGRTSRLAALVSAITVIAVPGAGAIPAAAQARVPAVLATSAVTSYTTDGSLAAVAGTSH